MRRHLVVVSGFLAVLFAAAVLPNLILEHPDQGAEIVGALTFLALVLTGFVVAPALVFPPSEMSADSGGLLFRWKYLVGGRVAQAPWPKVWVIGSRSSDSVTLEITWGSTSMIARRYASMRITRQDFELVEPVFVRRSQRYTMVDKTAP